MTMANQEERAEIAASLGRAMVDLQAAIDAEDQALADHLAIHRTDLRALDLVFRHGPLPAGRLAGMLGLTPGSVTALVDRLVKIDYVCRQPDPAHGRRVLIALTPRSAKLVTDLLGDRISAANAELAQFSDAELSAIRRFLLASTERHNRSAVTLRALPPVRAAL
jgi:DNA-binding MarR family transcriptional regulator